MREDIRQALIDPAFHFCIAETINTGDFIKEFDRLYGSNLQLKGAPIEREIDKATGKQRADLEAFVTFVYDYVYTPVAAELNSLEGTT